MPFPFPARIHLPKGQWHGPAAAVVTLSYDERFLRRKRLVTDAGEPLMVDLAQTLSLDPGDALETDDGRRVEVRAADEPVVRVTGPNLARLAWHIGNRHTPCEVRADHLVIRQDHVLEAMLVGLGAELVQVIGPFRPEGGAYGHGRTLGHDHGPHGFPLAHHG
ncbi:MAG: urease accessory protein [Xanthobacteraceae bacterium]|nr:MAG: urease accessory protein [Xanthobacteraceae bacterium]